VENRYSPRWVEPLTGAPNESLRRTVELCMSVLVTARCSGGSPARWRAGPVPAGERPLARMAAMASRAWPRK
jgi:hypothetical protein